MDDTPNICAGPFGAFYDFYIERPWLMRLIGRAIWGIDASVTFLTGRPRRAGALFAIGSRSGHPLPPRREDLLRWLTTAG
jgi:hypothetical protein